MGSEAWEGARWESRSHSASERGQRGGVPGSSRSAGPGAVFLVLGHPNTPRPYQAIVCPVVLVLVPKREEHAVKEGHAVVLLQGVFLNVFCVVLETLNLCHRNHLKSSFFHLVLRG